MIKKKSAEEVVADQPEQPSQECKANSAEDCSDCKCEDAVCPIEQENIEDNTPPEMVNGKVTISVSLQESPGGDAKSEPIIEKQVLPPRPVQPFPSKVTFSMGYTKSFGNYEFLRVDVSAEDYCDPENKKQTWEHLETVTTEKIKEVMTTIEKQRNAHNQLPEKKGDASQDSRRLIHGFIINLSKQGRLDYKSCIEKLRNTELMEDLAQDIIAQLKDGDFTFFGGDISIDKFEASLKEG
jgi:hypothetical protein